ncbi:hypothetical protein K466DRAFT_451916, partial [Polyporus arcularius HHB13444]
LRQEFRALELLDEVTRLRHLEQISSKVVGITRNELIHSFRQWKGESFTPAATHDALKWSSKDPFPIDKPVKDISWTVIAKPKESKVDNQPKSQKKKSIKYDTISLIPAKGSQASHKIGNTTKNAKRKVKRIKASQPPAGQSFRGFQWDSVNHSCAYDSILVVLLALYEDCKESWAANVAIQSDTLGFLSDMF